MLEGSALKNEVARLSDFTPTDSEAQHFLLATLVEEFSALVLHQLGSCEIRHLKQLHQSIGECLEAYEATVAPDAAQALPPQHPSMTEPFGLIIEDEGLIALDLKSALLRTGMTVDVAPSLARAWTIVKRRLPRIAVLDIRVLDGETYDLARYLLGEGTSVVFVTAYNSLPQDLHKVPCLLKPFNSGELTKILERALVELPQRLAT